MIFGVQDSVNTKLMVIFQNLILQVYVVILETEAYWSLIMLFQKINGKGFKLTFDCICWFLMQFSVPKCLNR